MKQRIWLSILFLIFTFYFSSLANAQTDTTMQKGIEVSLLTCGVGAEIYSVFGHTAVRIIDSNDGSDIVYNYGTFDGYEKDFELQFAKGKLLYYLSEDRFDDFVQWYGSGGRWVTEQKIVCSQEDKKHIQQYLQTNLLPENRAYKYDFFFDNCATRIRDIFTETFKEKFQYPNVLPEGKAITFRNIINQYLAHNVWERLGINILLGSKIDKPMTNAEIMFLPDYLSDGIGAAQLNQKLIAPKKEKILTGDEMKMPNDNSVLIVLFTILALTIIGLLLPQLKLLGAIMSNLLLFITGILGLLILTMWFATDHQTCAENYNLLWALPTNLLFLFKKKQHKYALIAIVLIFVSLLLHLMKIQELLLPEMIPILLSLLFIYGVNYKKAKLNASQNAKNTITQ